MLAGLGNQLYSLLESGGFDKVRDDLEKVLRSTFGREVLVEDSWIFTIPLVEVWGMITHGSGDIVQLLRENMLRATISDLLPSVWRGRIIRTSRSVLTSLVATRPRAIFFIRPFEFAVWSPPIIAIPIEASEVEPTARRLFKKEHPMLSFIPIDFTDLEKSLTLLRCEFPIAVNLVEEFFRNNQELFDLLQTLGTLYEEVHRNAIIFLIPHQKIIEDRDVENPRTLETLADIVFLALFPAYELFQAGLSPYPRLNMLKAYVWAGRELTNWLRKKKFEITKTSLFPQELSTSYPLLHHIRVKPSDEFDNFIYMIKIKRREE